MDPVFNLDEREEERSTVQFRKDLCIVTDLAGEIVSSDEADFIKIFTPGDPLNIIDTVVNDEHKARFPRAWADYQGMVGAKVSGTLLDTWDIHVNMIKVLKDLGFSTIEQVASASEHSLMRLQGGWGWKSKAIKFLEESKPKADDRLAKLEAENMEMREMLKQLTQRKAS
jgi:hypothetical protein